MAEVENRLAVARWLLVGLTLLVVALPAGAMPLLGAAPAQAAAGSDSGGWILLDFKNQWDGPNAGTFRAFWLVASTALVTVPLAWLLGKGRSSIAVYRPYEERLLKLNRLELEDMLEYHAQFKWSDYSGVAVGLVLVSVPLMIVNLRDMSDLVIAIQRVIVLLMAIAVVLLVFADLIHTNTQTPIIPINQRFRLIDFSVRMGTFGTITLLLSVLMLASLIGLVVTAIACAAFLFMLIYSNLLRRVKKVDFFRYFGLVDPGTWTQVGRRLGKPEDDRRFLGDARFVSSSRDASREVFYAKKRGQWSAGAVAEEWLQEMQSSGVIEETLRTRLHDRLWHHTDSTRGENRFELALRDLEGRLEASGYADEKGSAAILRSFEACWREFSRGDEPPPESGDDPA